MFGRRKVKPSQEEFFRALILRGMSSQEAIKTIASWSSHFATGINPTGNPVQWLQNYHSKSYGLLASFGVQDEDIAWHWGRPEEARSCQLGLAGLDSLALYLRLREDGVEHETASIRQSQSHPKYVVLPQLPAELEQALPVELAQRVNQFILNNQGFRATEGQTFAQAIWDLVGSGNFPIGKY
jgi:hypothetical protein